MKALRLPEELRPSLQKPLGRLLKGELEEIYSIILREAERLRPQRIVAVGDIVVGDSLKFNLRLDVAIADLKTKRVQREKPPPSIFRRVVKVSNPPGFITFEALETVKRCVTEGGGVLIVVEGEEDLLTIPAVLYAPRGSFIMYGQPDEGVVLVVADEDAKRFFEKLINNFVPVEVHS